MAAGDRKRAFSVPARGRDDVIDALAYMEQMVATPRNYTREGRLNDDWNPIAGKM